MQMIKTYMAHHQGLILLSVNNLINNNILPERFMANPEMKAIDILLQERMPESLIVTKEKKEKVERVVNFDYETYTQREISKINNNLKQINVILIIIMQLLWTKKEMVTVSIKIF